jgi:PAS domain S-box-containing protein
MLARLNELIVERSRFIDLALRSVEDGLVIASADGGITFANRSAADILNSSEHALIGSDLFAALQEDGSAALAALGRVAIERAPIEREISIRRARTRQYLLRLAPVSTAGRHEGAVIGIVATLSDITRHKELHQVKNDVISLVSHEMRTPLAAIQGMSELLASYDMDPDRRREMNLAINDEVKRLTRMITEYLDIARLESGATILRRAPLRLEPLLARSVLLLEPIAAAKGIRVTRRFQPELPAVLADADLLSRAVENLLSNAIKYSPPETEVTVSLRETPAAVAIEVADQGCGIPDSDLGRIFDKFYRVARLEDAGAPGTGLGLALVREIAELHGGFVTVTSEADAGSTFTLHLPLSAKEARHGS